MSIKHDRRNMINENTLNVLKITIAQGNTYKLSVSQDKECL